jgi:hypothetical protein
VPPGAEGVPEHVRQHAYQGVAVAHPSGTRVVVGNRHASKLEIYGADGALIATTDGPYPFRPKYSVGEGKQPSFEAASDLRYGYLSVAATDQHILALFSGRTHYPFPTTAVYGRYVHVFDWDGRFIKALRLDRDVHFIATGAPYTQLYAAALEPEPAVLEYPIGAAL